MKRIVFYSDSQVLGGHEIMSTKIWLAIRDKFQTDFIISSSNENFYEGLKSLNAKITKIPIKADKYSILRNRLPFKRSNEIKRLISDLNPDLIIALQGNIDISNSGVRIARQLGIPVWSYIPLAQSLKNISKGKGAIIKDWLRKKSYLSPDGFITISETQKELLKEHGVTSSIHILHNLIEKDKLSIIDEIQARKDIGLPLDKSILGYVGRFEPWHKGLDKYMDFLENRAKKYKDVIFLFVGSGSAQSRLEQLAFNNENIIIQSWESNLSKIYSSIDGLIMPSRFEGVSLTMLEAFFYKIPVIGNNIKELQEFLPNTNLFDLNSQAEMDSVINKWLHNNCEIVKLDESYTDTMHFKREVNLILDEILELSSSKESKKC